MYFAITFSFFEFTWKINLFWDYFIIEKFIYKFMKSEDSNKFVM